MLYVILIAVGIVCHGLMWGVTLFAFEKFRDLTEYEAPVSMGAPDFLKFFGPIVWPVFLPALIGYLACYLRSREYREKKLEEQKKKLEKSRQEIKGLLGESDQEIGGFLGESETAAMFTEESLFEKLMEVE